MIESTFMHSLRSPSEFTPLLALASSVLTDVNDNIPGYADEDSEDFTTFPTRGMPFFSYSLIFPADEESSTAKLKDFKSITGRSVKEYMTAYSNSRTVRFKHFRKQYLKYFETTEDATILSAFLASHFNRRNARDAWLSGEGNVPVLELDILDRWRTYRGIKDNPRGFVVIPRSFCDSTSDARRLVSLQSYICLLIPIADHLVQLNRAGREVNAQEAWLAFNAWWAVASLMEDSNILVQLGHLWSQAADLMVITADSRKEAMSLMMLKAQTVPTVPAADMAPLEKLMEEAEWLSYAPNLMFNWRRAEEMLTQPREWLSTFKSTHLKSIPTLQREGLLSFAGYRFLTHRNGEIKAQHDNDQLLIEAVAENLAALRDESAAESMNAAIETLNQHARTLREWMAGLERGDVCLYEVAENATAPETISVEAFSETGKLLPSELLTASLKASITNDRMVTTLEELDQSLSSLESGGQMSLAERLHQIGKTQELMAQKREYLMSTHITALIKLLDAVPWDRLSLVRLVNEGEEVEKALSKTEDKERIDRALSELQDELSVKQQKIDALKDALRESEEEAAGLRDNLATLHGHESHALPATTSFASPSLIEAIQAYAQSCNASDALRLIADCYPTRVRVLESAIESATEASSTLSGSGLLRKLMALADKGWEALAEGEPLYSIKDVVPGNLARHESDTVSKHPKLRDERIFAEKTPDGIKYWEMHSHLALDDRHRLYFIWDEDGQQIVIGHAGRHLGTAKMS